MSKTRISKPSAPASSSKGPRTSLPKQRVSTGRKRSVEAGEGSEREQQTEEPAAVRAPKRRKSEGVGRTGKLISLDVFFVDFLFGLLGRWIFTMMKLYWSVFMSGLRPREMIHSMFVLVTLF